MKVSPMLNKFKALSVGAKMLVYTAVIASGVAGTMLISTSALLEKELQQIDLSSTKEKFSSIFFLPPTTSCQTAPDNITKICVTDNNGGIILAGDTLIIEIYFRIECNTGTATINLNGTAEWGCAPANVVSPVSFTGGSGAVTINYPLLPHITSTVVVTSPLPRGKNISFFAKPFSTTLSGSYGTCNGVNLTTIIPVQSPLISTGSVHIPGKAATLIKDAQPNTNLSFGFTTSGGSATLRDTISNLITSSDISFGPDGMLMVSTAAGDVYTLPNSASSFSQPLDTILVVVTPGSTGNQVCFDSLLQMNIPANRTSICNAGNDVTNTTLTMNDTCVTFDAPSGAFGILDTLCIVSCYGFGLDTIYDTTSIIIISKPPLDTFTVIMNPGQVRSVCYASLLQLSPMDVVKTSICDNPQPGGTAIALGSGSQMDSCVTATAPLANFGIVDSVCIISCYAFGADTIYDTTTLIVIVTPPPVTIPRIVIQVGVLDAICYDASQELGPNPVKTSFCSDTSNNGLSGEMLLNNCFVFMADSGTSGVIDTVCIVSCYVIGIDTIYDTTNIILTISPISCGEFVCVDRVTVLLAENCEKILDPYEVLQNPDMASQLYTLTISDEAGNKIPNTTFTRANLGYCYTYSVSSPFCPDNSCWGTVCVEDKSPPSIDCTPDTILCFELGQLPSVLTINDNCAGPVKLLVAGERYVDYGCDSPNIQGIVTRRLVATDPWGNATECNKQYYIRKIGFADIVCPRDTSVDCSLALVGGVLFTDPSRSGAPKVGNISLWPNNPSCKLTLNFRDDKLDICGGGYKIVRSWLISDWCTGLDTVCTQLIKVQDITAPLARDITYPTKPADPHDCRASFRLDTLAVSDCGRVIQVYTYPYLDEATGVTRIAKGVLPATIWVASGRTEVMITLTDGCNNITNRKIILNVVDLTPPNPICHEFTQVTVDPASCWATIAAKDLDNGSFDNCISTLHYAAAYMADIEKARKDYTKYIIDSCGNAEYWNNKAWYDATIEEWINCYVFDDSLDVNNCGSNQVVLRVYEADSMPRLDPHIWSCGVHEWFCYNTYTNYRIIHNLNFFKQDGAENCETKGPWLCKNASLNYYSNNAHYNFGEYFANRGPNFPQTRLFNDCMVQVLVDDKQAPVVAKLQDITVYCDNAPAGSAYARNFCTYTESFNPWPGDIKDIKGMVAGYYGGSDIVVNHTQTDDHGDVVGCPNGENWAPIYCRAWLLLDGFDQGEKVNPKTYFDTLVLFDKNRPRYTLRTGQFSISDNCKIDDETLKIKDEGSLNSCGEGWIQRTWTIKDKCGNPVTATQKVIIKHRSDFEVLFPADKEVTCETTSATDTSKTGSPSVSDDECETIGVHYEDEISTVGDDACYKIIRTWTLIDWCIYDANAHTIHPDVIVDDRLRANATDRACIFRNLKDNGDGYIKYVQIIKVTDHEAPVISCKDTTICMDGPCVIDVNLPINGIDNCTKDLLYSIDVTRPDGIVETKVNVGSIKGSFTAGLHHIRVIGKDQCGNEDTCTMVLTINDCKAPTPYCLNGVATVIMPSSGSLEIWAKDLDRASEDNCTSRDKLRFSFTEDVSTASRIVNCSDIPNGKEQAIELEIWVTDQASNQNFCKTYVLLQDNGAVNGGVCADSTVALANITGRLYTEDKEGVEFATVELKGQGSSGIPSFKTSSDGGFSFTSIPMNGERSIKALRDDNPMNGVSTLDLVLIQKHILGTEKLKTPYKIIAADVNNSNDISVLDLIELRKLILGIYDKVPNNTSWKFLPKSYAFQDVLNPWGYPTEDKLVDMKETMVRDFIGVKIGDVNSSAVSHSLMGTEIRSGETGLIIEVEDQIFKAGDEVTVAFKSPNFKGVSGFQGTLTMSSELRAASETHTSLLEAGKLNMTHNNFGTRWMNEGLLTMSWNTHTSMDVKEDEVLFTMNFVAQTAGRLSEVLRIGSQRTKAESYEGRGELGNLSLRFVDKNGQEITGKSELYQNYPNPFDQRTVIGIQLAESGKGVLKITDIMGRTIKMIEREWNKGYQEVWMSRQELGAAGVLYYSFESLPSGQAGKTFKATKKMVSLQ